MRGENSSTLRASILGFRPVLPVKPLPYAAKPNMLHLAIDAVVLRSYAGSLIFFMNAT